MSKLAWEWTLGVAACAALVGCTATAPSASTALPQQETRQAAAAACKRASEAEVAALFDRWNQSLQTGDARKVVANYADHSLLLPTVSNKPRLTAAEKQDYFEHFLENQPTGRIDMRFVKVDCNTAVDAGLYTFSFAKTGAQVKGRYSFTYEWDGQAWKISTHHSSAMPEKP